MIAPGVTEVVVDVDVLVVVEDAFVFVVFAVLDDAEVTGVLVDIVKPLVVTVGTVTATVTGAALTTCTFGVTTAAIKAPA